MGLGANVECINCGFSYDICPGYGGIYDCHVFVCRDCKDIFSVHLPHKKKLISFRYGQLKAFDAIVEQDDRSFIRYMNGRKIRCKSCSGKNIYEIGEDDIWKLSDETNSLLKIRCPKCNHRLKNSGEIWFDD